jgi:hypothetical protein
MLFKMILKLFGLVVPAKIEAVKASLDGNGHGRRDGGDHGKSRDNCGGLIALYRWTADAYGVYDADQFRQAAIGKRVVLPAQKRDLLVAVAEKP